jgi:hypothetical protein
MDCEREGGEEDEQGCGGCHVELEVVGSEVVAEEEAHAARGGREFGKPFVGERTRRKAIPREGGRVGGAAKRGDVAPSGEEES